MHKKSCRHKSDWAAPIAVLFLIIFSLLSRQASARTPNKAFLLSLDVPFMGFYYDRMETRSTVWHSKYFSGGIGGGQPISTVSDSFPFVPRIEVGFGGKISKHLVIGANLQATFTAGKTKHKIGNGVIIDGNVRVYCLGALPFLEILLANNASIIPFIRATGGLRMDRIKMIENDGGVDYRRKTPRGVVGLGGGVYFFLSTHSSLDITLSGMFEKGKSIYSIYDRYDHDGQGFTSTGEDDFIRVYGDLTLGLSIWI